MINNFCIKQCITTKSNLSRVTPFLVIIYSNVILCSCDTSSRIPSTHFGTIVIFRLPGYIYAANCDIWRRLSVTIVNKCSQIYYCTGEAKMQKQAAQRATLCAPEYNVLPVWRISQGDHFCILISQKTRTW